MKMILGEALTELRAGPGETDPGSRTIQAPNGRYYSANAKRFPSTISVWDSNGRYLEALRIDVGASGPLAIYVDGESRLHVRDASLRWTIYDARHNVTANYPAPPVHCLRRSTVMLDTGHLVTSERPHGRVRHAFRVFGDGGVLLSSFGPALEVEPALVRSSERTFWAGWIEDSECVLALYKASGERTRELRVNVPADLGMPSPPMLRISTLTQAGDETLVAVMVAGRAARTLEGRDETGVMVSIGVVDPTQRSATYSKPVEAAEARTFLPTGFLEGQSKAYLLRQEGDSVVELVCPYSFTQ